ncbi:MAG TPA: hypothetical protein VFF64_24405 [Candidatus Eremiobacteraceae bacterium]|nr:hypothetical protein [Candidatus Eremiobacteraceae bacterium]
MPSIALPQMRQYLSRSIASLNLNKLRGTLAEVDFRDHLSSIGFAGRVSPGGWIARRKGENVFAHSTVAIFPEIVDPAQDYGPNRILPNPSQGLHTICATLHQSGIASFYSAATITAGDDPFVGMTWQAIELGVPMQGQYQSLAQALTPLQFANRERRYNHLRYHTDTSLIPDGAVPEEFSKEHLRVSFSTAYMAELSDIDGIFWGRWNTYPIEIKEKTPAPSRDMGLFFGLDVGPFVKLAFYAAKRGNLHSLYVVREIDNANDRNLVQWWFITFDQLAQFASWIPQAGGPAMGGGQSSVVRVPRIEFQPLNAQTLGAL